MISHRTKDALGAYRDGRRVSRRIRAMHPDGVPPEVVEATAGKLGADAAPVPQPDRRGPGRRPGPLDRLAAGPGPAIGRGDRPPGHRVARGRAGPHLAEIAERLNDRKRKTPRGKWTHKQVKRVLERIRPGSSPEFQTPV